MLSIVFVLLSLTYSQALLSDKRLIEFNETHRIWMDEAGVKECGASGQGFMDITDHLDLKNKFKGANPAPPLEPIHKVEVRDLIALLNENNIAATITKLSSYRTRYYSTQTGIQAAEWIANEYQSLANAAGRSDVKVSLFETSRQQPSQPCVIARIEGTGANKNEIVIVGAHEDSINRGSSGTAPGADDDASGVAVDIEVFRVIMDRGITFSRTVEFHGYAAEEIGLIGSQDVASAYAAKNEVVAGMMQMDMTGYLGSGNEVIALASDYTDKYLTDFVKTLVDAYCDIPWVDTACGYGCSDHASWNKAGYRSVFPFEATFSASNPSIHSANDVLSRISATHMKEFAKLALGFVMELGLDTSL